MTKQLGTQLLGVGAAQHPWELIWLREHGAALDMDYGERCTVTQPMFPHLPVNIFMDTVY